MSVERSERMRVPREKRAKILIEEQRLLARLSHEFYMNLRPLQDRLGARLRALLRGFKDTVSEDHARFDEALRLVDIIFQDHLNLLPVKLLESYAHINIKAGEFVDWERRLILDEGDVGVFKETPPEAPEVLIMGEPEDFYHIEEDELPPYEPSQVKPAEIGGIRGVPYGRPVIVAGEFDPRAKRYMEELALRKCVTLNEVQKVPVKKALLYSFEKSEPLRHTVRRMEKHIFNLKFWQIERIARTETHQVYNWSKYKEYQDDSFIESMQWLTVGDNRVRVSHRKCHLIVRRKGEPFPNGLLYPHDPSAPAWEVIQCRCTIVPYIINPSTPPAPRTRTETQMVPEALWKPPREKTPEYSFQIPETHKTRQDDTRDDLMAQIQRELQGYPEPLRALIHDIRITGDGYSGLNIPTATITLNPGADWRLDLAFLTGHLIDIIPPDLELDPPIHKGRGGGSWSWGSTSRFTGLLATKGLIGEARDILMAPRVFMGAIDLTDLPGALLRMLREDPSMRVFQGRPHSRGFLDRVLQYHGTNLDELIKAWSMM